MSVIVKGMEMPNVCAYCFLDAGECNLHAEVNIWRERHPDCPLVGIPTPHGRLADLDKMINDFWDCDSMIIGNYELEKIKTVIEAEGSET